MSYTSAESRIRKDEQIAQNGLTSAEIEEEDKQSYDD
jgi:hypothetical protein